MSAWLSLKLRDQVGLTNEFLLSGSGGRVSFDHEVAVTTETSIRPGYRPLTAEASAVIHAEVASMLLLDLKAHRRGIRMLPTDSARAVAIVGHPQSDVDGREEFLRWFAKLVRVRIPTVVSDRLVTNLGGEPADVLQDWISQLDHQAGRSPARVPAAADLLERLVSRRSAGDPDTLLVANAVDMVTTAEAQSWLAKEAFPRLLDAGYSLAVTLAPGHPMLSLMESSLGARLRVELIGPPNLDEVRQHYRRYVDDDQLFEATRLRGSSYGHFKLIATDWELQQEHHA